MSSGVRLAVDVGTVRVGVARSDPDGILATPVETIARDPSPRRADLARLVELARDLAVAEVVVGLPRSLSGADGPAARQARSYAAALAAQLHEAASGDGAVPARVRLVDERWTTVQSHRQLRESGIAARTARNVVDQAAAVALLQNVLDAERTSGNPPGELVPYGTGKSRRKGRHR